MINITLLMGSILCTKKNTPTIIPLARSISNSRFIEMLSPEIIHDTNHVLFQILPAHVDFVAHPIEISFGVGNKQLMSIPLHYINLVYQLFNLPPPITMQDEWINIPLSCVCVDASVDINQIGIVDCNRNPAIIDTRLIIDPNAPQIQVLNGPVMAYIIDKDSVQIPEFFRYFIFDDMREIDYVDITQDDDVLAISLYDNEYVTDYWMKLMVPGDYSPPFRGRTTHIIGPGKYMTFKNINLLRSTIDYEEELKFTIKSAKYNHYSLVVDLDTQAMRNINLVRCLTGKSYVDRFSFAVLFDHKPPSHFTIQNNAPTALIIHLQHQNIVDSEDDAQTIYRTESRLVYFDRWNNTSQYLYIHDMYGKQHDVYLTNSPEELEKQVSLSFYAQGEQLTMLGAKMSYDVAVYKHNEKYCISDKVGAITYASDKPIDGIVFYKK